MIQGDYFLFEYSGTRNWVQVDDVDNTSYTPGGIYSNPKTPVATWYCVPGANMECVNGPPDKGQFFWNTSNWRPGIYHFSDENAPLSGGYGTPALIELRARSPVYQRSCCELTPVFGTDCTLWDVNNWSGPQPGACGTQCWVPYITSARQWDIVRFSWSGTHNVFQSTSSNDAPTGVPVAGGLSSGSMVYCRPGAAYKCIQGVNSTSQFIWEVKNSAATSWFFYSLGNTSRDDSNMGAIVSVSSRAQPNAALKPCPAVPVTPPKVATPVTTKPPTIVTLSLTTLLSQLNAPRVAYHQAQVVWNSTLALASLGVALKCNASITVPNPTGVIGATFKGVTAVPGGTAFTDQKPYYNCTTDTCLTGHGCQDFRQVIWGTARHVGCAAARCYVHSPYGTSSPSWELFVCTFDSHSILAPHRPFAATQC